MRAVQEGQVIVVTCDKGMNQATDPRLSPPGTFEIVQNMRIRGAGVLEKRPGSRAIGSAKTFNLIPQITGSGSDAVPSFIASCGSVGVIGTSVGEIYAHQEVTDALVPQGRFSSCQPIRRRSVIAGAMTGAGGGTVGAFGLRPVSTALSSDGYLMVAALDELADNSFVYIETPEGVRIYSRLTADPSYTHMKCIALGAAFALVWISGTTLFVQGFSVQSTTVLIGVATNIGSPDVGSYLDVCAIDATSWAVIFTAAGPPGVVVAKKLTGATIDATITYTITSVSPVSIFANATNVWLGWTTIVGATSTLHYAVRLVTDMTEVRGDTTLASQDGAGPPLFGPALADTEAIFVYGYPTNQATFTPPGGYKTQVGVVHTAGAADVRANYSGIFPISKPSDGGRVWFIAFGATANSILARVFLGRIFPEDSGGTGTASGMWNGMVIELAQDEMPFEFGDTSLSQTDFFSAATFNADVGYVFAAPFTLAIIDDEFLRRVDVLQYSTTDTEPQRITTGLGVGLAVAGQPHEVNVLSLGQVSTTSTFMGEGAVEIGFVYPPVITAATSGSSSVIAAGDYVYQALWEWIDMGGARHRSAPSAPFELTVPTPVSSVTITELSGAYEATTRKSAYGPIQQPYLVVYRTQSGGEIPQRLPKSSFSATLSDTFSDSDIADEEFIYTAGGVLANTLAPSCRFMRQASGRLWCGGLWLRDQLECSKLTVPDEQVAFTGDATHRLSIGAECTGLAVMDDQLVAFSEDATFAISGEGPNDQGIGSFAVRSVSSGIGCTDARSIVETDLGVIFLSRLGWMLLPRGFGPPQYIGSAVRSTVEDFPVPLASAVRHGNGTYIARLLVSDGEADPDTRVLCFDINSGNWFLDTTEEPMGALGVWPSGFVLCQDTLDSATAPNPIWIEDPGEVADAVRSGFTGFHIEQRFRTNWIMPSGPGGWGETKQALFAMLPASAASVTTRIESDSASSGHEISWSIAASSDPAYRYLVPPDRFGVGFRISAWDGEVSSEPAPGVKFLAVSLEYDPDGGLRVSNVEEKA